MDDKTCPKCPNSPPMKKASHLGLVSAVLAGERIAGPSEPKSGFPLAIYECPHCHLIEFYREP
jgi:hypothetical protein